MKLSVDSIEWLKVKEGFSSKAYKDDQAGTEKIEYSIGYGHQIKTGEEYLMRETITKAKGETLLRSDLLAAENAVSKIKKKLDQGKFDALVLFTYNCGVGAMSKVATTVENGTDEDVMAHLRKYKYSGGKISAVLVGRREYECSLYKKKVTPKRAI